MHYIYLCLWLILIGQNKTLAQEKIQAQAKVPTTIWLFDGAVYELYGLSWMQPDDIKASSTLVSNSNRYQVQHLVDEKRTTTWVEGVQGNGIGEKIKATFSGLPPSVLTFVPGYWKSEATWYQNNRVAKLRVTLLGTEDGAPQVLYDFEVTFPKGKDGKVSPAVYSIELGGRFLNNMDIDLFNAIEIEILEVDAKGAKYEDTCISEIAFLQSKDEVLKTMSIEAYNKMTSETKND